MGALLIGGIWWWGARRSRQAPGAAELRETMDTPPPLPRTDFGESGPEVGHIEPFEVAPAEPRQFGVPPFAPIEVRTVDFAGVPVLDEPVLIEPGRAAGPAPVSQEPSGGAHASAQQRIVTLRVCGVREARWAGTDLMSALERQGLAHGKYQVFHRRQSDGRTLFCVASLIEPGSFDLANMPTQEFRGVTLFAVLPGPADALQIWDAMYAAAQRLAADLSAMVQDSKGMPLSPQRAAQLREDVARFQAALP